VFRRANTYEGTLWALPFNKSVLVVYYNQEMFQREGIPRPQNEWTWADFVSMAHKLTKVKDGDGSIDQYGYANKLSEWLFLCLLHQNGGSVFDEAERKVLFAQGPGIKSLNFLVDLITREKVAYYSTGFNDQNDFAAEKVALIISSCASRIYLEPVLRFQWGCLPLPKADQAAAVVSGTNIVIFRGPDKKKMEGAWRFVKYFTETDTTLRWSVATGYLPVRISALHSNALATAIAQNPRIEAAVLQLAYSVSSPKHAVWNKGRDHVIHALEESYLANIPPSVSLTQAALQTQKLLDRYHQHEGPLLD
jgi:multiple sugar transport system substrate-binding protein